MSAGLSVALTALLSIGSSAFEASFFDGQARKAYERGRYIDALEAFMLVDQIAKLRTDQHKEMLNTVFQLEPHLRPDQRERLRAVLAERFAGSPQPPRPPRGAPGAPGAPGRPSR